MAFSVADRVKVVDESSEFRGLRGTVTAVSGGFNTVRLETQGCKGGDTQLRDLQLGLDTSTMRTSYAQCTG